MKRVRRPAAIIPVKRTKNDDNNDLNWLTAVFLADPIMARVAHYLDTPALFQFLLGVSKALRDKATKTDRWNAIMQFQKRLLRDLNVVFEPAESQSVLWMFVNRMYTRCICSLCHQLYTRDVLLFRPFCKDLRCCDVCRVSRKLIVTDADFAERFVRHPDLLVQVPVRRPWTHEYVGVVLQVYSRKQLELQSYHYGKPGDDWFPVVDYDQKRHWAYLRKTPSFESNVRVECQSDPSWPQYGRSWLPLN
jgi:hypothetical protein